MTLATRTVTLPGGLQATLVHQPQADRAAALARVAAGSHHEPSRFPGLAHLLEHLLFYGGERYQDDDRLMGWVQRQGGSVNATTLARHSAFFFEVAADALADGVARLQEMLQAPLLLREDIQREVAVIDAEYRLIQQHEPSRREAAVRHAASAPAAFRRFQVGSADALAGDLASAAGRLRRFSPHPLRRPANAALGCRGRSRWRRSASWRPVRRRACRRRGSAAGAAAAPGRVHCTAAGGLQPARAVALPADRF